MRGPELLVKASVSPAAVPASRPALALLDLSISQRLRRTEKRLVTHVDLEVGQGEIVGLVGESGSGKSLTALACMGLLPSGLAVTGGDVHLDGASLLGLAPKAFRALRGNAISMIFQDPLSSLDPCARIGAQIIETIRAHKDVSASQAKRDAIELLDRVGIPRAAQRMRAYPHEFSGGMRQRVMIAAALVLKPRVLLADEPTTALDVTTQAGIVELVRELCRELQMSVVWISHDLALVSELADRVAVMYAGEIVEVADSKVLFRVSRHPYTKGLVASGSIRPYGERFSYIPGSIAEPGTWPTGCRFAPRCERVREECVGEHPDFRSGTTTVRCVNPIEYEAE
ncbi:MAG: oligopeptide/dipeptide transporter, ATPase subunit [Acidimicrobiaceae bacterium]|nr:oligopeptide/dipeptide transporter, ATPase subunit [Acidimicrobiaceae bacterium]